jgi:hypothetical protein
VFFRNQDLTIDDQKSLGQKLGELTGKPETSKLHRHALSNSKRGIAVDENGKLDDEVSVISSEVSTGRQRQYSETDSFSKIVPTIKIATDTTQNALQVKAGTLSMFVERQCSTC